MGSYALASLYLNQIAPRMPPLGARTQTERSSVPEVSKSGGTGTQTEAMPSAEAGSEEIRGTKHIVNSPGKSVILMKRGRRVSVARQAKQ